NEEGVIDLGEVIEALKHPNKIHPIAAPSEHADFNGACSAGVKWRRIEDFPLPPRARPCTAEALAARFLKFEPKPLLAKEIPNWTEHASSWRSVTRNDRKTTITTIGDAGCVLQQSPGKKCHQPSPCSVSFRRTWVRSQTVTPASSHTASRAVSALRA